MQGELVNIDIAAIGEQSGIGFIDDQSGDISSFANEFPEYYAPWTLRLVLGLQDSDMRRFLYTNREMEEGESRYPLLPNGEPNMTARRRLFGEDELNELLSRCVFANVKPARRGFVAIDAIRSIDDEGNHRSWGDWDFAGLVIQNSLKTSKRLSTLTRDSFLAWAFDDDELAIEIVENDDIGDYSETNDPKALDGANVISFGFYKRMMEQCFERAGIDRKTMRGRQIWNRIMQSRSGQFRMLRSDGIWKGDYIVSERENLTTWEVDETNHFTPYALDIRCFHDNRKSEVAWTQGTFILLEPHPNHPDQIVYTDDQTQSWLLRSVFSKETLSAAMRDMSKKQINSLAAGIVPEYLARYNPDNEEENQGQISNVQAVITKFITGGIDIRLSQWAILQLGRGYLKMLESSKHRSRFPMPGAARWHVATQAWLNMAEWYDVEQSLPGHSRYSKEVQRLVYNDADFVANYTNHGGHDLDDTHVVIHCRVKGGADRFITYRTPNSFGEYSVMKVQPDSLVPTWIDANGMTWEPNLVTLKNLPETIDNIDNLVGTRPEAKKVTGDFDIEAFKSRLEKTFNATGVGRWVNTQITWFWTTNRPRPEQLTPTEFVVDTHIQDMDPDRIALCGLDYELTMEQLKNCLEEDEAINLDLWDQRIDRRKRDYEHFRYTTTGERAELRQLFEICKKEFEGQLKVLARDCGKQILPIIKDWYWANSTIEKSASFRNFFAASLDRATNEGIDKNHIFWNDLAKRMSIKLNKMELPALRTKMLIHTAYIKYTRSQPDTILFQNTLELETSVVDHWIEALRTIAFHNFTSVVCNKGVTKSISQ